MWLDRLRRGAEVVGAALFALLFLVFVVQVSARFLFNRPLPWTDEAAVILYLWAILWAAAFVCRDREHVAFDLVHHAFGATGRRRMAVAACLLIGVLAAWALPGSWDYIQFMQREKTPVIGLPFAWVFLPFALLLVALVVRNAWRLWRLLTGADEELA